jgi:hypothetical protein
MMREADAPHRSAAAAARHDADSGRLSLIASAPSDVKTVSLPMYTGGAAVGSVAFEYAYM